MDRYDFASVVDDIFKECKTIEGLCSRHAQLKCDLENLFRQNISLIIAEKEKGGDDNA
jgi:plasmid replication initiation protein